MLALARGHQLRYQRRRVLEVAVHDDDPVGGRGPDPLDDRAAEPAGRGVAVQHGHRVRAVPRGVPDHLGGVVGGVVHEHDLAGQPRGHRLGDPAQQLPDVRGLVEGRHDDGDGAGFGNGGGRVQGGVVQLPRDGGLVRHRSPPVVVAPAVSAVLVVPAVEPPSTCRISIRSGPLPKVATGRRMPHRLPDVGQVGRVAPHGRGGDDVVDVAPAARHRLGHRGVEVGLVEPDDAEARLVAGVHEVEPERVVDEYAGVLGVRRPRWPATWRPPGRGRWRRR